MKQCALAFNGAPGSLRDKRRGQRGFTLLEMCTVLFIIMILLGVMMPAMQSAFTEQAVRGDARELSLMVKTAMLQSSEQHRAYVIDLTATTMAMHPAGGITQDTDAADADEDTSAKSPAAEDIEVSWQLNHPNKLLMPDPKKANVWIDMPLTSWVIQPGELCPVPRVRIARGNDWIEMSFNPLTGNVDDEATYLP